MLAEFSFVLCDVEGIFDSVEKGSRDGGVIDGLL